VYRTPEDKIAGFVTYHPLEGYKGRIQFLVVAKEFRKKGYAKELMQYAINGLKKQGMCFIEIAVRAHNEPAVNLYKKFGFKEIASTPDGFLYMSKSLCGSMQQSSAPAAVDW
jgi:ribosomal protein S18 acetylase RimI-like enzyme